MKVLILGDKNRVKEFSAKFGNVAECEPADTNSHDVLDKADVIFDFLVEESMHHLPGYASSDKPVFLSTAKTNLRRISLFHAIMPNWFGFNGLPGFINRDLMEVTLLNENQKTLLKETCKKLDTEFIVVDDRVGMVTPRVICMIINEAYYTNSEGTASREDIDLAMKLGTNYPYGPFEWSAKIGISNVYEILQAVYEDSKDDRYKICPALKNEYLDDLSMNKES